MMRPVAISLYLLLALGLCACTLLPPASPPSVSAPSAPPVDREREAVRLQLREGNPLAALEAIRRAVRAGVKETAFIEEYPVAANDAVAGADLLRVRGEYAWAGENYRQVLEMYPRSAEVASRIARTRQEIEADLDGCAERLMERGLSEYRKGKLEEAVAAWQQILSFSPDHMGARQAVDTASRQMESLKGLGTSQ